VGFSLLLLDLSEPPQPLYSLRHHSASYAKVDGSPPMLAQRCNHGVPTSSRTPFGLTEHQELRTTDRKLVPAADWCPIGRKAS